MPNCHLRARARLPYENERVANILRSSSLPIHKLSSDQDFLRSQTEAREDMRSSTLKIKTACGWNLYVAPTLRCSCKAIRTQEKRRASPQKRKQRVDTPKIVRSLDHNMSISAPKILLQRTARDLTYIVACDFFIYVAMQH